MTKPPRTSRRKWLQSGMLGTMAGGVAAGLLADERAQALESGSDLTITDVRTFSLQHEIPRAIGPSTLYYKFRDALLVKISTDSGLVGWGETADVGGTQGIIEDHLKHVLLGKNPLRYRELWRQLWGANFGDGRAVAGVDIAINDLRGKALGLSISELFGGPVRENVMAYAAALNYTEGVDPEDQHPAEARQLVERGFRAIKARTGRYGHARDINVLRQVREAVGDEIRLLTDGNGGFTFPAAVKFGKALEELNFYCFEEPLPQGLNYAGYDELARSLDIALSGGEVIDSRATAREHVARRSFDIIQPDVTLCGGVAEVLFIAEMARLFGLQCIPHCWGGGIAIYATLQLLSLLPTENWGFSADAPMLEFDTYENPFRDEILDQPPEVVDGFVSLPKKPGLGVEVHEDLLRKYLAKK